MVLMVKRTSTNFTVRETSDVGHVRREVCVVAGTVGFDENLKGRVAIIVTEMGTNLVRHAGGGEIVVNTVQGPNCLGLEILSLDKGSGVVDTEKCMADGFSTGGSPGTGLGAIRRQSTHFDLFSHKDLGTAILATVWPSSAEKKVGISSGGICVAVHGEKESGDAWCVMNTVPQVLKLLVVDGLGHGPKASEAAQEAVKIFELTESLSLPKTLERIHLALRKTRGAAVAVSELNVQEAKLSFAGVGNISATIHGSQGQKGIASSNGIAGHNMKRITDFLFSWLKDDTLILHSDGLQSRWNLNQNPGYAGLMEHHPSLVAGVLFRDFRRTNDDCTVVTIKPSHRVSHA
jgi:anti-sigma regulatory factor (Ser/Thr protein kinase)